MASRTPQWPWSVYSSTQRSAIRTISVAQFLAQRGQRHLDDTLGRPGLAALSVLGGGHAEEDYSRDAEAGTAGVLP